MRPTGMIPDYFFPATVALCLAAVIAVYFCNNPLNHARWFMMRRFINWFPLGLTYAFLCMGRYNLIVAKGALGSLMSKSDLGIIFGVGTWVYASSFLVNGPLIDKKLGGKRGMIISAVGVSLSNIALGVLTWLIIAKHLKINLVASFSLLYAINMYFQSFGSMSIIKVKAYWFHVRERGVFGAIFGALISIGVYFAFDWGGSIIAMTKANSTGILHDIFVSAANPSDATWSIFYVPAIILIFWAAIDVWLIKDTPEQCGFVRANARRIFRGRSAEKDFRQPIDADDRVHRTDRRSFPLQHDAMVFHFCRRRAAVRRGIFFAPLGLVHLRFRNRRRICRRFDF
jgi:OPA family glycerol-3-phosphate transporter-like MFS transporter